MNTSVIRSIATAVPPHVVDQSTAIDALRQWLSQDGPPSALTLDKAVQVFEHAGVTQRHTVVPLGELLTDRSFGDKNRLYMEHARTLGECALRRIFHSGTLKPHDVDLFITTSCTGFMIPSLDAYLMNRFPFRHDVKRLPITELGCAAGVAALRIADDFLRAYPGATVLILAVELTSLTFQPTDRSGDHIVSTAIFGDGAAAALLSNVPHPGLAITETATRFFPGTTEFMGFDVEETGFHIFLSPRIPVFVRRDLMPVITEFLSERAQHERIDAWLIHPGGPKILDAIEDVLDLERGALVYSREVLRRVGNLSSATIFFVLDRYLQRARPQSGARQLVAAVGPGFQADFVVLECQGENWS
ncbi:MAG: type III polyketide synthase [Candidatus Binatia bacterium]